MEDVEARERVGRVEALLEGLESLPDPAVRDAALETVQALLELYGEGLGRIVERVGEVDGVAADLAGDELVSHLLLLHDLHPVDVETRVRGALGEVRPYLESHGGNVEFLGVEEGVARLRLEGSCSGCPSSAMTLKLAIEDAIHKAAPDVERVEAEGVAAPAPPPAPAAGPKLVQLPMAGVPPPDGNGAGSAGEAAWAAAGSLPQLASGGTLVKTVAGEPVLFLALAGTFYAYRPACPGCRGSLEGAALRGGELTCPGCGNRYDAQRAGRCLDAPQLHLDPVPLLVGDAGIVTVAVGAGAA